MMLFSVSNDHFYKLNFPSIVAVAVIIPVGYSQFFERHYTTVSANDVNADYIFSANFSKYTETSPYYNPNFRYMNTTTIIDRGTANQSELLSNVTLSEWYVIGCKFYCAVYKMNVTGNFSRNVLPGGMNIETEGMNLSPRLGSHFNYNTISYNTSIKSYSTVRGSLYSLVFSHGFLLECYGGNFTNLVTFEFLNTTSNNSISSERFQFQATLGVRFEIPAVSIYTHPFNFIANTTLTGYSEPVYNTIGVEYVDNSTAKIMVPGNG